MVHHRRSRSSIDAKPEKSETTGRRDVLKMEFVEFQSQLEPRVLRAVNFTYQ
jgi:hypothetical protein